MSKQDWIQAIGLLTTDPRFAHVESPLLLAFAEEVAAFTASFGGQKDVEAAFAKEMEEKQYGVEETMDARAWFTAGWEHRDRALYGEACLLTREQAIDYARANAYAKHHEHDYLPKTVEQAATWQPHEWVVAAIRWARPFPRHPGANDTDPWKPSEVDYDRDIHANPDAAAWADFFVQTFPGQAAQRDLMLGWFANAMMAMHDHLKSKEP